MVFKILVPHYLFSIPNLGLKCVFCKVFMKPFTIECYVCIYQLFQYITNNIADD